MYEQRAGAPIYESQSLHSSPETYNPFLLLKHYYTTQSVARTLAGGALDVGNDILYGAFYGLGLVLIQLSMVTARIKTIEDVDWTSSALVPSTFAHGFSALATFPLMLSGFCVRQNSWKGFRALFPSSNNFVHYARDLWLPYFLEMHLMVTLRPVITSLYYALAVPLVLEPLEKSDSILGRVMYQVAIRGVHLLSATTLALVHMPVSVVGAKLRMHPEAYGEGGAVECVKRIWRRNGIRGFYQHFGLYLLGHVEFCFPQGFY